jgi:hypothetical protein
VTLASWVKATDMPSSKTLGVFDIPRKSLGGDAPHLPASPLGYTHCLARDWARSFCKFLFNPPSTLLISYAHIVDRKPQPRESV